MYPGSYAMEFVGYAKESITPWLCYGIFIVVVWQDLYQQTTAPGPRRTVLCLCEDSLSLTKHLWLFGHNNKYLLVIQSGSSFLGTPSIIVPIPIVRPAVTGSWRPKTVQSNNNIVRSTTKNSVWCFRGSSLLELMTILLTWGTGLLEKNRLWLFGVATIIYQYHFTCFKKIRTNGWWWQPSTAKFTSFATDCTFCRPSKDWELG